MPVKKKKKITNRKKTNRKPVKNGKKNTQKTMTPAEIVDIMRVYQEKLSFLGSLGRKTKDERVISVFFAGENQFLVFSISRARIYLLGEIDHTKQLFKFDRSFPAQLLPNGKEYISLK